MFEGAGGKKWEDGAVKTGVLLLLKQKREGNTR